MQQDAITRLVTHMDPNEIDLFVLYRTQFVALGGRSRDDLPYTTEFDALRHHYNTLHPPALNEYEFWGLLKQVLKAGEDHVEDYLRRMGVPFPPKP